jgi:peptidoglycan/LPS O-acetylase OafA/YrhL
MTFRPDIQILRAISVILVVIFHLDIHFYFDSGHLTLTGAKLLIGPLGAAIESLGARP